MYYKTNGENSVDQIQGGCTCLKEDSNSQRTSTCEHLDSDHIMSYLLRSDLGLLSNQQYGFVHGRSTMLQLLHMLDDWTENLESGGQIYVI